jgi:DNA-binding MarR family transcriptional regulator
MMKKCNFNLGRDTTDMFSFSIYSSGRAVNKLYRPLLEEVGLTYPQYLVMLLLWQNDGMRVKELGEHLFLDSGTLTPLLQRREVSGLITRVRSRADERQVLVHLTAEGHSIKERAESIPLRIQAAIGLDVDVMASIQTVLNGFRDRTYKKL